MQITVEKVVWIALVLVVVAVVGLFLMGNVITQSAQVGQRFYVRLISSQYNDADQSYVISFRLVNTGEGGKKINGVTVQAQGFGSANPTVEFISPCTGGSCSLSPPLDPKGTVDITVRVGSGGYVTGTKSLIVTCTFEDGTTAAQSITIP
ncbi:MAG: hypothetical protein QXO55_06160 [Candidatus Korarchaeum sp.]